MRSIVTTPVRRLSAWHVPSGVSVLSLADGKSREYSNTPRIESVNVGGFLQYPNKVLVNVVNEYANSAEAKKAIALKRKVVDKSGTVAVVPATANLSRIFYDIITEDNTRSRVEIVDSSGKELNVGMFDDSIESEFYEVTGKRIGDFKPHIRDMIVRGFDSFNFKDMSKAMKHELFRMVVTDSERIYAKFHRDSLSAMREFVSDMVDIRGDVDENILYGVYNVITYRPMMLYTGAPGVCPVAGADLVETLLASKDSLQLQGCANMEVLIPSDTPFLFAKGSYSQVITQQSSGRTIPVKTLEERKAAVDCVKLSSLDSTTATVLRNSLESVGLRKKTGRFFEEVIFTAKEPSDINRFSLHLMVFNSSDLDATGKTHATPAHSHNNGDRLLIIYTASDKSGMTVNVKGRCEEKERDDTKVEIEFEPNSVSFATFPVHATHEFHGKFIALSIHKDDIHLINMLKEGKLPLGEILEYATIFTDDPDVTGRLDDFVERVGVDADTLRGAGKFTERLQEEEKAEDYTRGK